MFSITKGIQIIKTYKLLKHKMLACKRLSANILMC